MPKIHAITWNMGGKRASSEIVREFAQEIRALVISNGTLPEIIAMSMQAELAPTGWRFQDKLLRELNKNRTLYTLVDTQEPQSHAIATQRNPLVETLGLSFITSQNRMSMALFVRSDYTLGNASADIIFSKDQNKSIITIQGTLMNLQEMHGAGWEVIISSGYVDVQQGKKRRAHVGSFFEKLGIKSEIKKFDEIYEEANKIRILMGNFSEKQSPAEKVIYKGYGFTFETEPRIMVEEPDPKRKMKFDKIVYSSGLPVIQIGDYGIQLKRYYQGVDHIPVVRTLEINTVENETKLSVVGRYLLARWHMFDSQKWGPLPVEKKEKLKQHFELLGSKISTLVEGDANALVEKLNEAFLERAFNVITKYNELLAVILETAASTSPSFLELASGVVKLLYEKKISELNGEKFSSEKDLMEALKKLDYFMERQRHKNRDFLRVKKALAAVESTYGYDTSAILAEEQPRHQQAKMLLATFIARTVRIFFPREEKKTPRSKPPS